MSFIQGGNAMAGKKKDIQKQKVQAPLADITERRKIEYGMEKARKELEATKISEDAAGVVFVLEDS